MVLKHYRSGVDFLKDLKESKHSANNSNKKNKFIKRKKSKSPISSSKVTRKDGADWIRYLEQLLEQQQQEESLRTSSGSSSNLKSTGSSTDLFKDSPLWSLLFGLNCSTLTSSSSSKCFDRSNDIMWRFWKWNSSPFRSFSSRSSRSSLTSGALFDNRSNSIQDLLFSRSNIGEDDVIGKPLYFVDRFKNNLNQSMEHCYSTNQLKQLAILEYTDLYRYVTDDFDEYDSEQLEELSSRRVSSSSIAAAGSGVPGSRRMSTGNGRSTRTYFIFKDGVPPLWEDEYNAAGGCWSLILNRDQLRSSQFNSARQLWKLLIGLVIDDRMKIYLDEICGFGLSIKSNGTYKITVWNRDSDHTIVKMMIGQLLKSLINIPSISMSYYSHKTTICKAYRQGRPSQSTNNVRNNSRLHHNQSDQYLSNNRRLRSFSRSPTTDSPLYSPNHRNIGCTYGTGSLEDIEHHFVGHNSPNSSFPNFFTNLNSRYPQQQQRSTSSTQNLFSSSNSHLSRFWDLNEEPQPQQQTNMGYSQFYKHIPAHYFNKSSSNNFFQQDSDSTFTSTLFSQFPTRSNNFNINSNLNNRTNNFPLLQNNHNYSNIRNNSNRNFYNNRY